jgi:hypothetical protein
MNRVRSIPYLVLLLAATVVPGFAQQRSRLGDNAALRYWAAFAQMQDSAITNEQAKELNLILEGTAPYSDLKYGDLVEKNRPAVESMIRGTSIPACDWGMDYGLGHDTPVDYVRRALELGRLNVLYSFHLLTTQDKDGAVRALAAGIRFSRDVANGGTLFATLVAKSLLVEDLRSMSFALHAEELSPAQKSILQKSVAQLGTDSLDWEAAVKRELALLRVPVRTTEGSKALDAKATAALASITSPYVALMSDPSVLARLQETIAAAPQPLRNRIPNPKHVLEAKQDLTDKIVQIRSSFQ